MRFLAIITRNTEDFSEAQFAELLEPEAERVRELYSQGVIRSVSSRGDVKGAVLEVEAADQQEAEKALNTLPFAAKKMARLQTIPLLPYRGFAPRG